MLHFVDTSSGYIDELRRVFAGVTDVDCAAGDILAVARNAIVSPANSYGFMDGGIDAAYLAFFGPAIQVAVQEAINRRPEGHLPVGASLAVRTGHGRIPFLIVAPTMHTPEEVPSTNCYRAMRAVLRLMKNEPELGREVYCPGLATGIGGVSPNEAAAQIFRAYDDWQSESPPAILGYLFVRRGTTTGWSGSPDLLYVCEKCGVGMPADQNDDFSCACGAMDLDTGARRFGSTFGDSAILTYRRR